MLHKTKKKLQKRTGLREKIYLDQDAAWLGQDAVLGSVQTGSVVGAQACLDDCGGNLLGPAAAGTEVCAAAVGSNGVSLTARLPPRSTMRTTGAAGR